MNPNIFAKQLFPEDVGPSRFCRTSMGYLLWPIYNLESLLSLLAHGRYDFVGGYDGVNMVIYGSFMAHQ